MKKTFTVTVSKTYTFTEQEILDEHEDTYITDPEAAAELMAEDEINKELNRGQFFASEMNYEVKTEIAK